MRVLVYPGPLSDLRWGASTHGRQSDFGQVNYGRYVTSQLLASSTQILLA